MAYAKGDVVVLDDARMWFDKKTKQVYLGSTDPDLGGGGLRMPIKPGSPLERSALNTLKALGVLSEKDENAYPQVSRTWTSISIGRTLQDEDVRIGSEDAYRFNAAPGMAVACADGRRRSDFLSFLTNELPRAGMDALLIRGVAQNPDHRSPVWSTLRRGLLVLDDDALTARPGSLDALLSIADARDAAKLLIDAIFQAIPQGDFKGSKHAQWRAMVGSEVIDHAIDARNKTAHDVLFGNGTDTGPISDGELLDFVHKMIQDRPLWAALIATDPKTETLRAEIERRGLTVIEVPGLASPQVPRVELTERELDTQIAMSTVFVEAAENLQRYGGALLLDGEQVLKGSPMAMQTFERAGRTWRQRATMVVLGLSSMDEFGPGTQGGYIFDRFLDLGTEPGTAHLKDDIINWEGQIRPGNEM